MPRAPAPHQSDATDPAVTDRVEIPQCSDLLLRRDVLSFGWTFVLLFLCRGPRQARLTRKNPFEAQSLW